MRERSWYDKHRWRLKHGLPEIEVEGHLLDELRETEWSPMFEKLMRNRLLMGALRYGRMGHGNIPKGKPVYDRVTSIEKRLGFFKEDKNLEWLVDISNMCLLIFEEKSIPNSHFSSVDDVYHDEIIK